ncbi:alpha/beta hydrolase fold domain-containing protein [Candidatus Hydrogenedentota bacterium]
MKTTQFMLTLAIALILCTGCASQVPRGVEMEPNVFESIQAELMKFDHAEDHIVKPGPGGTEWDSQYRSFIQTNEKAVSKGFPSHSEAAEQIIADARLSAENMTKHKNRTIFIKHFSSKYRPHEATTALWVLYRKLVYIEHGQKPPWAPAPRTESDKSFEGDPRLTVYRDVVYGNIDPKFQNLDAYVMKSDKPTPVVVEIHGGGWRRGTKNMFESYKGNFVEKILDAGISVVSIQYRLTTHYPMPACMEDAARAVQFVRSKADEWNIDPSHIAAMGGSAGAHISAWVALHDDMAKPGSNDLVERESTRLSCFIDHWGPMDMTRFDPTGILRPNNSRGEDMGDAFRQAFACALEDYKSPAVQKRTRAASPVFLVTADDPPAFIFHKAAESITNSDHDPVPDIINDGHSPWHGVLLGDAMDKAGVGVVRYIGPHVGKDPEKDAQVRLEFLKKHLNVK